MKNNETILEMKNIDKRFTGVHALKNCSFELRKGEIHALCGENGAGKSTMMKILTGIYSLDEGEIIYKNNSVKFTSPKQAQEAGISIVHQELNMMNHLTVAQNLFIGREGKGFFLNESAINKKTKELFDLLKLDIDPSTITGDLTVGKQQMVEIAKAISFDASVVIFDEPTAALTEKEIAELFSIMMDLKKRGVAMVYISHRMDEILQITDRVTVMRDGEYIGTLETPNTTKEEIINMMVGRTIFEEPKTVNNTPANAPTILEVNNLCSKDVKNVSFDLKKGEILGFAGLMGAGRTEVARLIFGADPLTEGSISINGEKVSIKSPEDAVQKGIGYLSEDRKRFGLALGLSVADNTVLASLSEFTKMGLINESKIDEVAKKYIKEINIKTPSSEQLVKNLSGGNQQKVIIGRWLHRNCDILIFDEPTRGIDVGAKSEIYKIINDLAKQGKAIIVISSELPELLRLSDRVAVMCEGRLTKILDISECSQETIMSYATLRND